ncbi:MAG TPA: hypothetical protein DCE81_10605 [Cytophagales bacterium]|nr:hypothetical protein [Cytophagales bacterium]
MKTFAIGIFFVASTLNDCLAQQVLFKGGISASKVTDNAVDPENSQPRLKPGFLIGLSVEPKSSARVVFYPELYFVQKGYKTSETSGNGVNVSLREEMNLRVNYLELPLHAKIYTNSKARNTFLLAGFYTAIAVGGNYSYYYRKQVASNVEEVTTSGKIDFDEKLVGEEGEDFSVNNTFDFGFQLGFGFTVFKRSALELRYSFGAVNLSNGDDSEPKNRAFLVSLGIPLSKKVKIQ